MSDPLAIQAGEEIPAEAHIIWWTQELYTGGPGIEGDVYVDRGSALAACFVLDRWDSRYKIIPYEVEQAR